MSNGDTQDGNKASGRNDKPNKSAKRAKTYWPLRWMQFLLRRAQRENAQRNQYRNYRNGAEVDLLMSLRMAEMKFPWLFSPFALIIGGLVVLFVLYWTGVLFDEHGKPDPNWVIAVFTIVMAFTTLLQWVAIGVSNAEFVRQNDIMKEQINHMRAQSEQLDMQNRQTDEMIHHMRLEQRAWLAVENPEVETWQSGQQVLCAIYVKNTGRVPAVIHSEVLGVNIVPDEWIDGVVSKLEKQAAEGRGTIVQLCVAPGARTRMPVLGVVLGEAELKAIEVGGSILYFYGHLLYSDGVNDNSVTQFLYTHVLNRKTNKRELMGHHRHNKMT